MSESRPRSTTTTTTRGRANPRDTTIREARVTIDEADLATVGIADLVALWRHAGVRAFEALGCDATGAVVQLHLERPLDQQRVTSLDPVDRSARVADPSGEAVYVIAFTAPRFPPGVAADRPELLDTCALELHDDGLAFSLVGPPESVASAIAALESDDLSPALQRVGPYTGRDGPLDALTDRQREVLTTAYDLGYYEVPRRVSADEIATELGLEASTVSEHLQRAERNFLTRQLGPHRKAPEPSDHV